MFADDIKLYLIFDHNNVHQNSSLQQNINNLMEQSSWGLKMINSKCVVIRFCSNDPDIPVSGMFPYKINPEHILFVDCYKNFGTAVDRTLKFHSHITKKVSVLHSPTGAPAKPRPFFTPRPGQTSPTTGGCSPGFTYFY